VGQVVIDEAAVHSHMRGFIRLIEVTEPLTTQDMNNADSPKYIDLVRKIRRNGRNTTDHMVRLVNDVQPLYQHALSSFKEDLTYLFDNIFPPVRKSLEKKIRAATCQSYEELLTAMKTSPDTVRTDDSDIASLITSASPADSQDTPRGSIRSSFKKIGMFIPFGID